MAKALEDTEQKQEQPSLETNTSLQVKVVLWPLGLCQSAGGREAGDSLEVAAAGVWGPAVGGLEGKADLDTAQGAGQGALKQGPAVGGLEGKADLDTAQGAGRGALKQGQAEASQALGPSALSCHTPAGWGGSQPSRHTPTPPVSPPWHGSAANRASRSGLLGAPRTSPKGPWVQAAPRKSCFAERTSLALENQSGEEAVNRFSLPFPLSKCNDSYDLSHF